MKKNTEIRMRRQLSRGETEEEKVKEKAYTEKKRMGNRKCREIYCTVSLRNW